MSEVKELTPAQLERHGIGRAANFLPKAEDPSAQMMAVITRAAADPAVDVDKMERLLDMQERMLNRNAKVAFAEGLVRVQTALPRVTRQRAIKHDGKKPGEDPKVISTYASWEDIDEVVRPILDANGFALTFRVETLDDRTVVTAVLTHEGGHEERTGFKLPLDTGGAKNNVQAYGSTITYGKRYTACALLNIITEDDDTDGVVARAYSELAQSFIDRLETCKLEEYPAIADEVRASKGKLGREYNSIATACASRKSALEAQMDGAE